MNKLKTVVYRDHGQFLISLDGLGPFPWDRLAQDHEIEMHNEILRLSAELEATQAILSLYRDEASNVARKIGNGTFKTSQGRTMVRLLALKSLTPESVGEEFNAMRSALIRLRSSLVAYSIDPEADRLIETINGILGDRGPVKKSD